MTSTTATSRRRRAAARMLGVLAALTTGLAGCAVDADEPTPQTSTPPALTVTDPWVKAADSGMTAAFGTIVNNTGTEITIASATSTVSIVELHEVVMDGGAMTMQPKNGGFVVAANGTHELKPGGDHLMLMDVKAPVKAGDQVEFVLTLNDGSTVTFSAVAKPFAGGNESYDAGMPTSATPSDG